MELIFTEKFEKNLTKNKLSFEQIQKMHTLLEEVLKNPYVLSEKLQGYPLRKIRFGQLRIFVLIENGNMYCVGIAKRAHCYNHDFLQSLKKG